jgi:Rrf2 family protein
MDYRAFVSFILEFLIDKYDNQSMRVSQKAKYAVRASLDLALNAPPDRGLRSAEVARRAGVPEKFLEAILRDLREAGLVESKRGPDGGHRLALDPSRVSVGAVVEAIDGPLSTTSSKRRSSVSREDACVRALWQRAEAAVHEVLGTVTLDDLRREARTPEALDFTI